MRPENELAFIKPLCFDEGLEELCDIIVATHDAVVQRRGYNPSLTQEELIEQRGMVLAALGSSFSTYFNNSPCERYQDIFHQLADFASRFSKDHIFPDGNKRTTVVITLALAYIAGAFPDMKDTEEPESNELYLWIQEVVTGKSSETALAEFLRNKSIPTASLANPR